MTVFRSCLIVVVLCAALAAQEPVSVPTLSEADSNTIEVAYLRSVIAQQNLDRVAQTFAKDGFELTRGTDGRWAYTPNPKGRH